MTLPTLPTPPPEPTDPTLLPAYYAAVTAYWQLNDITLRDQGRIDYETALTNQQTAITNTQAQATASTAATNSLASANAAQAAAIQAMVAMQKTLVVDTDAELLASFLRAELGAGKTGPTVITDAQAQLAAYKKAISAPPGVTTVP